MYIVYDDQFLFFKHICNLNINTIIFTVILTIKIYTYYLRKYIMFIKNKIYSIGKIEFKAIFL